MGLSENDYFLNKNPNLKNLDSDNLYHLGLSTKSTNFKKMFGDVRVVCVGGSASRMEKFAKDLAVEAGVMTELINHAQTGGRYVMYKVGAVLVANHGMGTPSMSIILHEIFKLLSYAECRNVSFIRIGTSGGIGIPAGTVVLTTEPLNTECEPVYKVFVLGKLVERPTALNLSLVDELYDLAQTLPERMTVIKGKTMCANDFYEEQARLDGAFCDYSEQEKVVYLKKLFELGARNLEMESSCLGALCRHAGFPAAVVCTTLLDRLKSDQIKIAPEDYALYEQLPATLVIAYLKKHNALSC